MNYKTISTTVMHPNIYGGKECNEHIPQWRGHFYDEENTDLESIELNPKAFPAGTRITIQVPLCPKCNMEQEMCECGFDWVAWTECNYG